MNAASHPFPYRHAAVLLLAAASWVTLAAPSHAASDSCGGDGLKTAFEKSAKHARKALAPLIGGDSVAKQLEEIEFSVESSADFRLRSTRRYGERRVSASCVWLQAASDMLLAYQVSDKDSRRGCFDGYAKTLLERIRANREETQAARSALPRFADFAHEQRGGTCKDIGQKDLQISRTQDLLADRLEAALLWVIGREVHAQLRGRAGRPPTLDETDQWTLNRMFDLGFDPLEAHPVVLLLVATAPAADGKPLDRYVDFLRAVKAKRADLPGYREKMGHPPDDEQAIDKLIARANENWQAFVNDGRPTTVAGGAPSVR